MSNEHKEVPASEAEAISRRYAKSMVVIVAYDPVTHLIELTTFGTNPATKSAAAATALVLSRALGFKPGLEEKA